MENREMNKIQGVPNRATLCVAAILFCMTGTVFAQANKLTPSGPTRPGQQSKLANREDKKEAAGGESKEKSDKVEIKRIPQPNKTAMVRTPEYNVNVQNTMPKVSKKPREWALLEVKYETGSKWTDELTFNYYVMTKAKSDEGKDVFSFYTQTLRYVDVPKGEHMSCVGISPSLIERYGEPVAIALEIVGKDGTVLDSKNEALIPLPKEWWKDSKVLDNPSVTRRNGMVDRSKTPFALINVDDYEVVQ